MDEFRYEPLALCCMKTGRSHFSVKIYVTSFCSRKQWMFSVSGCYFNIPKPQENYLVSVTESLSMAPEYEKEGKIIKIFQMQAI